MASVSHAHFGPETALLRGLFQAAMALVDVEPGLVLASTMTMPAGISATSHMFTCADWAVGNYSGDGTGGFVVSAAPKAATTTAAMPAHCSGLRISCRNRKPASAPSAGSRQVSVP